MWLVIEYLIVATLVLLSITEFFYPILSGKKIFGSFRKENSLKPTHQANIDLKSKIEDARQKVNEVKGVQQEVNKHFDEADKLKNESDDLIKK